MKEVICINIGQAGIRIGNAFWEQIALEHGIQPNGIKLNTGDHNGLSSFFFESGEEKVVPRCVSVDLENDTANEIRRSPYRELFQPDSFIYGKEAACTFSRGRDNKQIQEKLFEKIKTLTESCEGLQGFMIFSSIAGGTSGLYAAVLKHLNATYGKVNKINLTLCPSPKLSNSVIEPYNAVLANQIAIEYSDLNLLFDNEAIYNILEQKLRIPDPSFGNINRLIAQVASSITANIRFEGGTANSSFGEITRNIVPYPRINFALSAYSPFTNVPMLYHEQPSISAITDELFDPRNTMIKCDYTQSRILACCVMYRGEALLYDINAAINSVKAQREMKFVDFIHTGIKTSTLSEPPVFLEDGDLAEVMRTSTMLMNTGAISTYFRGLANKFDKLYAKRVFVHFFDTLEEGEGDFSGSREDLEAIIKDYEEVCMDTAEPEQFDEDY
jgi:tubulin alpha